MKVKTILFKCQFADVGAVEIPIPVCAVQGKRLDRFYRLASKHRGWFLRTRSGYTLLGGNGRDAANRPIVLVRKEFWNKLNQRERDVVATHEACHILLGHDWRRMSVKDMHREIDCYLPKSYALALKRILNKYHQNRTGTS